MFKASPLPDIYSMMMARPDAPLGWAALRGLLQRLVASRYATGLFGYTSHETLALLQTREWARNQERLLIRPADGMLLFAFTDNWTWHAWRRKPLTLRGEPAWMHEYAESEAWPATERFLIRVGWFPKRLAAPDGYLL